ncbi:hypothetical protein ACET3Z_028003 [Daucus carota]
MDVRNMSVFQSDSFAAVIDKGTLDSLLCGHNSRENAAKMLREVARVLKANGVYILKNCRTGCNFHQWHDPPVCGRSGNIIPGLLKRIERLEREIEKRARNEKRMK